MSGEFTPGQPYVKSIGGYPTPKVEIRFQGSPEEQREACRKFSAVYAVHLSLPSIVEAAVDLLEATTRLATSLGHCQADHLNPCWDDRPTDVLGKHWGGGEACSFCWGRAALAKAGVK